MDIVIPTCGRWDKQLSLRPLLRAGLKVVLAVPERQAHQYWHHHGNGCVVVLVPHAMHNIALTRQWIVEHVGDSERLIMVDDDLTFFLRRDDERSKLQDITSSMLTHAFVEMDSLLMAYAHAGFASREGANRNTEDFVENTRILRVLGYNRAVLRKENIRFDDIQVMEDFHVALRLLRAGHKNIILNNYAHNQAGSGLTGGCSTYRTPGVQADAARRLAELHPGFVKVVEKQTKSGWGAGETGTRTDVVISWKKAYESSQKGKS